MQNGKHGPQECDLPEVTSGSDWGTQRLLTKRKAPSLTQAQRGYLQGSWPRKPNVSRLEDSLSYCFPCLCSHLPRRVGGYVNPSLCSIEPEDAQVPMRTVCQEHRHRPVQGHGVVQLVLEYVQIVEAIRLSTLGDLQSQVVCMLRDPIHMFHAWQREVQTHRRGTIRLAVRVSFERLLPGSWLIFLCLPLGLFWLVTIPRSFLGLGPIALSWVF